MKATRNLAKFALFTLCFLAFMTTVISESYSAGKISTNEKNIAIKGYDTVAYFTEGRAIKGNSKYSYKWEEVDWQFSSQQNRDLFAEAPVKYAPQFGGHCANGMSKGVVAGADPTQWTIVDGKLFLKYNLKARDHWRDNKTVMIAKAEENWAEINN